MKKSQANLKTHPENAGKLRHQNILSRASSVQCELAGKFVHTIKGTTPRETVEGNTYCRSHAKLVKGGVFE